MWLDLEFSLKEIDSFLSRSLRRGTLGFRRVLAASQYILETVFEKWDSHWLWLDFLACPSDKVDGLTLSG